MSRHAEAVRELQQCINEAQKSHELVPSNVIKKASVLLHQEQGLVLLQQKLSQKMWPRAPMDLAKRPFALRCPNVAGGLRIGDLVVCVRVPPLARDLGVTAGDAGGRGFNVGDVGTVVDVLLEAEESEEKQDALDQELDALRRKMARGPVPAEWGALPKKRDKPSPAVTAGKRQVKIRFDHLADTKDKEDTRDKGDTRGDTKELLGEKEKKALLITTKDKGDTKEDKGVVVLDAVLDVRKFVFQDAVRRVSPCVAVANRQIQAAQRSAPRLLLQLAGVANVLLMCC
jgi:hypothetical protein